MSAQQFHAEVMAELEQEECAYCGKPVPDGIHATQFECCGEIGHVRLVAPPIPVTEFDFCATAKDYEPGDPIGYGSTPGEAIADLKEQISD